MKKKTLIVSTALLLVAIMCLGTASFAWFSSVSSVDAKGMEFSASAGSSLVISKTATTTTTTGSSVDLMDDNETVKSLVPATIVNTGSTEAPSYALKTLKDTDYALISDSTGKASGPLTYAAAAETTNYVEKMVYIASLGDAKTGDLTITCDFGDVTKETMNAASVAFFKKDGNTETYIGTTNTLSGSGTATLSGVTAGQAGNNSDLVIIMRFFIDGALENTGADANYVRSSAVDIGNVTCDVTFAIN